MKFRAEAPDLNLELTTLDGQEEILIPKIALNTKSILAIMKKWEGMEKVEGVNPIEVSAAELADIYDKSPDWFLENLDLATVQEVLTHVARTMSTFKKKLSALN